MMIYSFDWSGAEGHAARRRNIACYGGNPHQAPVLVPAPDSPPGAYWNWNRLLVLGFLQNLAHQATDAGAILVGFDFAFSFPLLAPDNHFHDGTGNREALWENVWTGTWGPHGNHTAQGYVAAHGGFFQGGADYAPHLRLTEQVAHDQGANAQSVYYRGQGQVGKGSLCGISILHLLTRYCVLNNLPLCIWPFFHRDENGHQETNLFDGGWQPPKKCLTIVETYPRFHRIQAGVNGIAWNAPDVMPAVANFFQGALPQIPPANEDRFDSLVAWYALSGHAAINGTPLGWNRLAAPTQGLVEANPGVVENEGWIFGV